MKKTILTILGLLLAVPAFAQFDGGSGDGFDMDEVLLYTGSPNPNWWITDGTVYAIATDGTSTYIGGDFTYVGPNTGYGAKLTTTVDDPDMDFPKVNGVIYTSVPDGSGGWYIGGDFTKVGEFTRNRIAHINSDGSVDASWNPNANNLVLSIAIDGSDIYVGGSFSSIGGQARNYIAKLNNSTGAADATWNPNADNHVRSIVIDGSYIYAGGDFISIGGQSRWKIAKLNNSTGDADATWSSNANGVVYSIAIDGNDIYAGGGFTEIDGQTRNNIAKLNNSNGDADATWNPNASSAVYSIAIDVSNIYAGGSFTSIGGQTRNYIAKLNNSNGDADATWNPNASSAVLNIAIDGSDIYAGGSFTSIGGQTRNRIAKLNNSNGDADGTWNPNANSVVRSIAIDGSDIYAGGDFFSIGWQTRNRIAKLNNSTGAADASWNPNANNIVWSIAIDGSDIYAGGFFTSIGGQARDYIAKLNNSNGDADGTWIPNASFRVYCIAVDGSDIYAGGNFTSIGGQTRNYIAKLNNSNGDADATWNPDAGASVLSIAIDGSDIYAGGSFTSIGGQTRNRIAKLNNSNGNADATWNPDANGSVSSIAIDGSDIYAGGGFTSIGGQTRNYIAKLNNSNGNADATWDPDANSDVSSIAIDGSDIYAGGNFISIGGQTRNYIAKLNNSDGAADASWNPNANGSVSSIVIDGSDIYAGGGFTSIGGQPQARFAVFSSSFTPTLTTTAINSITSSSASSGGDITDDGGATVTASGIVYATTSGPEVGGGGVTNVATSPTTETGVFTSSLTSLLAETEYFVRAYATNSVGIGYGNEVSFFTYSNPASIQASNFQATITTADQIDLSWDAATFPGSGATVKNYLLIRAEGANNPVLTSSNGEAPAVDGNTTIVNQTIAEATTTFNNSGLTAGTQYNYMLIPFTWDGTNPETYNYLTASAPTVSETAVELPTVTTSAFSSLAKTDFDTGGEVTADGSGTVSARGVVWSTTTTPALTTNELGKTTDGTGTGTFASNVTGLSAATIYYVRAYATNEVGTSYGSEIEVKTLPTQATDIVFNNITANSFEIGWSRGNGDGVVVFLKQAENGTTTPVDGTNYTANTVFGSGTEIATGWFCVYDGAGSNVTVTNLNTINTYVAQAFEYVNFTGNNFTYNTETATGNPGSTGVPESWVSDDYSAGNPAGFGTTHFDDLDIAKSRTNTGGIINITNYTHDGNVDLSGYVVIIGVSDFAITNGTYTGQVQTPSTGKLVLPTMGGTNTYPLSDGSTGNGGNDGNFTIQITPSADEVFNVKITPKTDLPSEKQGGSGMLSNTLYEIETTAINPDATIVFRIPDASLAGGSLPENVVFRYWDDTEGRYVAISAENVEISDEGTYYIVTISNVNQF